VHEPELVRVAVGEVRVVALGGAGEVDRELAVEEDRRAAIEELAARGDLVALVESAADREAPPFFRDGRGEAAMTHGDLGVRGHRVAVVEIRKRPVEPAPRVHLLVEDVAARVAEYGVRLGREEPRAVTVDHGWFPVAAVPRCAFSMLSKRARKFP
jgi:hypothetical protein